MIPQIREEDGKAPTKHKHTTRRIFQRLLDEHHAAHVQHPISPDVLAYGEVMGEGVDLRRFCRHVIHHDLAWNPSVAEQRTARIDRIGYKAEGRHPIISYLPYLGGAADERQFRVMRDREQWFHVVMGQNAVADLIPADATEAMCLLPSLLVDSPRFDLCLPTSDRSPLS